MLDYGDVVRLGFGTRPEDCLAVEDDRPARVVAMIPRENHVDGVGKESECGQNRYQIECV